MACWTLYIVNQPDKELVTHQLTEHLGDVSGILFFLLGAMTLVELIDANDGFQIITDRIKTTSTAPKNRIRYSFRSRKYSGIQVTRKAPSITPGMFPEPPSTTTTDTTEPTPPTTEPQPTGFEGGG